MAAVFETDGIFSQNNELRMRSDLLHVRLHASALLQRLKQGALQTRDTLLIVYVLLFVSLTSN